MGFDATEDTGQGTEDREDGEVGSAHEDEDDEWDADARPRPSGQVCGVRVGMGCGKSRGHRSSQFSGASWAEVLVAPVRILLGTGGAGY